MSNDPYTRDGVNVKEGDSFSAFAAKCCRGTYEASPFVKIHDFSRGHFRGPRGFTVEGLLPGSSLACAPDGIGTKVIISDAAGFHFASGKDVLAMTAGDITRWGGIPLVFCNVLDVCTLGQAGDQTNQAFRQLINGLMVACGNNQMVMLCGETAELGVCVGSSNEAATAKYNWSGFAIGAYHPDKMILGDTLAPGQVVVALQENGFRSNGISSVRKAFAKRFGDNWAIEPEAKEHLRSAAVPSFLYDCFLTKLHGWYEADFLPLVRMHLIAHVTGGSIKSKFARDVLFPQGFSAILDDLFEPPEIVRLCADWRGMSVNDCYDTWNCGQGMLVVIDESDVAQFCHLAVKFGVTAKVAGKILPTPAGRNPSVLIHSKFGGGEVIEIQPE